MSQVPSRAPACRAGSRQTPLSCPGRRASRPAARARRSSHLGPRSLVRPRPSVFWRSRFGCVRFTVARCRSNAPAVHFRFCGIPFRFVTITQKPKSIVVKTRDRRDIEIYTRRYTFAWVVGRRSCSSTCFLPDPRVRSGLLDITCTLLYNASTV